MTQSPDQLNLLPQVAYRALDLVMLSSLLEQDMSTDTMALKQQLQDKGVGETRVRKGLKSLVAKGLAERTNNIVTVSQDGLDYVSQRLDYIDDAHCNLVDKHNFGPTKYRLLDFMEPDSEPASFTDQNQDGWLQSDNSETSIWDYIALEVDMDRKIVQRKMVDFNQRGFLEFHTLEGTHMFNNVRLTDAGRAELAVMRSIFPDEIAELNRQDMQRRMAAEISHMQQLLGDPQGEMPSTIDELDMVLTGLEARVDALLASRQLADPLYLAIAA
jgi:DNA-binding MarR family transcriptional regulator